MLVQKNYGNYLEHRFYFLLYFNFSVKFLDIFFRISCTTSISIFKYLVCSVTTSLVVILLISGTSYDLYLERSAKKEKMLAMNCTTYCNSTKYDSSTKLDVNIPEVKTKNGTY